MDTKRTGRRTQPLLLGGAVALLLSTSWAGWASGQSRPGTAAVPTSTRQEEIKPPAKLELPAPMEGGVVQASCTSCRGGGAGGHYPWCNLEGGPPPCVPGRFNDCCADHSSHPLGRMWHRFYEAICCQDPCYEPCWIPQANSALFVDAARPITHMRIRWDSAVNFTRPDMAEWFWSRINDNFTQPGKGPRRKEASLKYNDLIMYNEVAVEKMGFFFEMPYRSLDPRINDHASGFSDFNVGTKAILCDTDLFVLTFQFRTYLPVGNFTKGLGTGHVSLEPSLLWSLKLAQDTYMQGQLSETIPIAGDPIYAGSYLHYHFSLNHVLYRCKPDVPLIGMIELNGWSFQDGAFTDLVLGPFQGASEETIITFGPSIRLVICDKIDFGFGAAFSLTNNGGPEQFYRTEFRWRF